MARNRKSKRDLVREERRQKRHARLMSEHEEVRAAKRQRLEEHVEDQEEGQYIPLADGEGGHRKRHNGPEREYFGMLADEEQEYFRRADELLEINDFPSSDDRSVFLENVFKEAQGKELKLASSQSCSRLMERLIMLSTVKQKKSLYQAFATHFVTLVTHRFASHCCEQLFIQSAPVVTQELGGSFSDTEHDERSDARESSMEELFLLTLDEFEEHLTYLLSDKFASHALRVILVVLSGRPLNQLSTKSLLQSKKKEHITVSGRPAEADELHSQIRTVPESFTSATQKIIADSTSEMDDTALRVLAKHPTGNPVLQLLLELDIALNIKSKSQEPSEEPKQITLLEKLLPGAPYSLNDADSPAASFINTMLYDPIGSRLIETLVTHCPGKIFKGLHLNFFGPRIHNFLRNDIASYPAIKALNRLSKEDLVDAVNKTLPTMPVLVEKGRFNVVKALFDRCAARNAYGQLEALLKALCDAYGSDDGQCLILKLCFPDEEPPETKEKFQQSPQNKSASVSHGSQLAASMLGIRGDPSKTIQASLLALASEKLVHLATFSTHTSNMLITAFKTPSRDPIFHKSLVASLSPHAMDLAGSQFGHNVLNAIVTTPSKGDGIAVPFHVKEGIVTRLSRHETELRETWLGRSVWRTWKGDLWKHRRSDWVKWAKEVDPESARAATAPKPRRGNTFRPPPNRDSIGGVGGGGKEVGAEA